MIQHIGPHFSVLYARTVMLKGPLVARCVDEALGSKRACSWQASFTQRDDGSQVSAEPVANITRNCCGGLPTAISPKYIVLNFLTFQTVKKQTMIRKKKRETEREGKGDHTHARANKQKRRKGYNERNDYIFEIDERNVVAKRGGGC